MPIRLKQEKTQAMPGSFLLENTKLKQLTAILRKELAKLTDATKRQKVEIIRLERDLARKTQEMSQLKRELDRMKRGRHATKSDFGDF